MHPMGLGPQNFRLWDRTTMPWGAALAEELLKDYEESLEGRTLGLLLESTDSQAILDREQGFRDVAEKAGASVVWSMESSALGESAEVIAATAEGRLCGCS